jgi:NitT/TauT family transport system ATP-binding protein
MSKVIISRLGKVFEGAALQPPALQDIDLAIEQNEFVTLVGASGCGKSTLLRILAGLEHRTSGDVLCDGHSITGPGADRAMVFQHYSLYPWLNVIDNIKFSRLLGANRRDLSSADVEAASGRADALLNLIGLSKVAKSYPNQLSGGMQQRVAIARSLAVDPPLLLMDEPFGALDEMTRERMQNELLRIRKETGKSVIFVTHSIPEAVYLSDRVVVMSARPGRITDIVSVNLGDRSEETREADAFYAGVTAVREALRGHEHASDIRARIGEV